MLHEDYANGLLTIIKRAVVQVNSNPRYFVNVKKATYKNSNTKKYEKLSVHLDSISETEIVYILINVQSTYIGMAYRYAIDTVISKIKTDPEIRKYPYIKDISPIIDTNPILIKITIDIPPTNMSSKNDNKAINLYHLSNKSNLSIIYHFLNSY